MTSDPQDPPISYPGYREPLPAPPSPHLPPYPDVPPQVVYVQPAPLPPTTSPSAVASIWFGVGGLLTAWCTFGVPAVIGVILGHIGLIETRNNARPGRTAAVVGLAISYMTAVPLLIFWTLVATGRLE